MNHIRIHVYLLIFAVFFFDGSFSQSQSSIFENLTTEDGLSSNIVTCIFKDKRGFMWFGNQNGLNRYDGYGFEVWKHIPGDSTGISDNGITSIEEDGVGNIWIGTNNGLNKYSWYTDKFTSYYQEQGLSGNDIRSLYADVDGTVWVGTHKKGLNKIDSKTQQIEHVQIDDPNIGTVLVIEGDKTGNTLWLGTFNNGLTEYNPISGKADKIRFSDRKTSTPIYDLLLTGSNRLLIGTLEDGAFSYSLTDKSVKRLTGSGQMINALEEDKSGNIWMSQNHSLIKIKNNGDITRFNNETQNIKGIINDIFADDLGVLWLSSGVNGIYVHKNRQAFKQFYHRVTNNREEKNYVYTITQDNRGNIWMGTFGNGVFEFDKNFNLKNHFTTSNSPLPDNIIKCIAWDKKGQVWMGTQQGLARFNPKNGKWLKLITTLDNLWNNSVETLLADNNNHVWIGTLWGMNKYLPEKDTIISYKALDGATTYKINTILEDNMGNIWFGTYHGLFMISPETGEVKSFQVGTNPGGISNNKVLGLAKDNKGGIWVGTQNGLNRYSPRKGVFTWYFEKDGLVNNIAWSLVYDNRGKLWINTPSGMSVMDTESGDVANYNRQDGLETNYRSGVLTRDGMLIFGALETGFYAFHPDSLTKTEYETPLYITGISTGVDRVKPVPKNKKLVFKYNERGIRIHYTALNYIAPEKNLYTYKLEGFDKEWATVPYTKREATYTNLPPGHYAFRVKVSGNTASLGKNGDHVHIEILPPWWQSTRMYSVYIAFLLAILAIVFVLRDRRNRLLNNLRAANEKAYLSEERAKLQHQADQQKLKFFTNISHEFRTPLTLISVPLENLMAEGKASDYAREQINHIKANTRRLQNLINELIDYRKLTLKKKNTYPRITEINTFVESIYEVYKPLAHKNNIRYVFNAPTVSRKVVIDSNVLDKVVHNLVSNAFKNTPDGGVVKIDMQVSGEDKTLAIDVSNSGKGIAPEHMGHIFDRFYQIPPDDYNTSDGTGIGLSIVKEYIELIQGEIHVESTPGQTTTFTIKVPYAATDDKTADMENVARKTKLESYDKYLINLEEKQIQDGEQVRKDEEHVKEDGKKLMLVVEDNHDMRNIVKALFMEEFEVMEAPDGKIGWEKARAHVPDIIISDIMMPEMDGVELCKKCKNHELTSHVPVVLLTAKAGEESKMAGYETGAEAYITKPFTASTLKALVLNILENRERLKKLFADPSNTGQLFSNVRDRKFADKVKVIIEKSMSDENFNVSQMAKELLLSTSQLHRKFKGLTGQSPGDYIRNYRMRRGAQLLKETDLTVNEISFKVGIKYPHHFSRLFLQEYGLSPTEYRQNQ